MSSDRSREPERVNIDGLSPAHVAMLKLVADEQVRQTLKGMGLNPEEPFEAQKDNIWVRSTRRRCEGVGAKALAASITLMVAVLAGMLWSGFKSNLPGGHP